MDTVQPASRSVSLMDRVLTESRMKCYSKVFISRVFVGELQVACMVRTHKRGKVNKFYFRCHKINTEARIAHLV
jgi:hypothetical protein